MSFFRDKSSDKIAWFIFGMGILIILWVFSLPGCKSAMPPVDVSFWAGDSAKEGITRSQESKTIACSDPAMDDYVCLSYEDVKKLFSILLQCQQWPSDINLVKTKALYRFLAKKNPEVDHALRSSHRY